MKIMALMRFLQERDNVVKHFPENTGPDGVPGQRPGSAPGHGYRRSMPAAMGRVGAFGAVVRSMRACGSEAVAVPAVRGRCAVARGAGFAARKPAAAIGRGTGSKKLLTRRNIANSHENHWVSFAFYPRVTTLSICR